SPAAMAASTLRTVDRRRERRVLLTSVRRTVWRAAFCAELVLAILSSFLDVGASPRRPGALNKLAASVLRVKQMHRPWRMGQGGSLGHRIEDQEAHGQRALFWLPRAAGKGCYRLRTSCHARGGHAATSHPGRQLAAPSNKAVRLELDQ